MAVKMKAFSLTRWGLVLLIFIRVFVFVQHWAVGVAVLPVHVVLFVVVLLVLVLFLLAAVLPRDDANTCVSHQTPATPRLQLRLRDLAVILLHLFIVIILLLIILLLLRVVVFSSGGSKASRDMVTITVKY